MYGQVSLLVLSHRYLVGEGGECGKAVDCALSPCKHCIRFKTYEDLDTPGSIITSIEP